MFKRGINYAYLIQSEDNTWITKTNYLIDQSNENHNSDKANIEILKCW